jgi:TetR/AcrR family fatty acid metabolism transcriptional regulator
MSQSGRAGGEASKTETRTKDNKDSRSEGKSGEAESGTRDDKRKQILKAAAKVFAEKGYHGARISDVAEEAGVAYGLVYHYFGNKEGLLRTIFETNWRFFATAIEEIADAELENREKIRQIVDFVVNAYEIAPMVVKVLVLEFGRSSRMGDALDEPDVNRVFRAVFSIFKDAARRQNLVSPCDPWALTIVFLGALESALASFVMPAQGEAEHSMEKSLLAMRETLLATYANGIFQRT